MQCDSRGEARAGACAVASLEPLIGRGSSRIDYRHIIHTLVRKPGAFRRYVFREALLPALEFRRAYDTLLEHAEQRARQEDQI